MKFELGPVTTSISYNKAYLAGLCFEKLYKLLGILKPEPPRTRCYCHANGKTPLFLPSKSQKMPLTIFLKSL